MPFIATWIDLEIIILSEVNHKEKDKYHIITTYRIKKIVKKELFYKTETDSQT